MRQSVKTRRDSRCHLSLGFLLFFVLFLFFPCCVARWNPPRQARQRCYNHSFLFSFCRCLHLLRLLSVLSYSPLSSSQFSSLRINVLFLLRSPSLVFRTTMGWNWKGCTADQSRVASKGMGRGGGSGRREPTVDESRKETADRVAKYQTDFVESTYVTRTAAAASGVLLLCFEFPVLSFRSWLYCVYVCFFSFVCHISRNGTTPLYFILFYFIVIFVYSSLLFFLPLNYLLCLLYYNVVSMS